MTPLMSAIVAVVVGTAAVHLTHNMWVGAAVFLAVFTVAALVGAPRTARTTS